MIQVGDKLPASTLMEFIAVETEGCSLGPNPVDVAQASAGKTIALFAVPGAFTPTCSAQHVPGYVEQAEAFSSKFMGPVSTAIMTPLMADRKSVV